MRAATRQVARRPGALWRFLTDRKAPVLPKLGMLFAVVYVIWPFDLIPDLAPVITWLDDLGVVGLAMAWMSNAVRAYAPEDVAREEIEA